MNLYTCRAREKDRGRVMNKTELERQQEESSIEQNRQE